MKLDALLRDHPNVQSVTLDAHDNVSSFSLAQVLPSATDEAVRSALGAHVRQEDTASGAGSEDDVVRRVRNVLESLLIGNLGRDDAEHRILGIFNEHVDLNRRAIHPDVEAVLIPDVGEPHLMGPVVGFIRAGRMFHLDGQPLRPLDEPEWRRRMTAIAIDRPKRMMVDRLQA